MVCWDSFTAGVDSNPNLSRAQKFAYLCAQVEGDTAHVISGFESLINHNYLPAVIFTSKKI